MTFWVFECMFVANNNLLMDEVFIGPTRKSVVEAMQLFFSVPRAKVLLTDAVGVYAVSEGKASSFVDAAPFLKIQIANTRLDFDRKGCGQLVGDLEGGGLSRTFLSAGRAMAEDAHEDDEDDDEDPVFVPFHFEFDAAAFLATLVEGGDSGALPDAPLELVRPPEASNWLDGDAFANALVVGPGWWDVEPYETPKPFAPKRRFVKDLEVPML